MAVQPAKSLHSCFFSACAGEGKDETSLSAENRKHLLYVLHSHLVHATGERLLLTLREKGVGLSYSLQECKDVRRECRACRKVNFRRRRLKRRGWKAKKRGKRKRAGVEEAPSGVGGDDESEGSDEESSSGDRHPSEKFNRIIYHNIKNMKKKGYGGFRYISVIVDWKFRCVSLKALWSKDHAERHLLSWIRRWEVAGFGKPLIVQSDNGGEFLGEERYLWVYENEGVDNEFGPPGTLEVQAFVERANLTFISLLNKFLLQARILFFMWLAVLPGVANALNDVVHNSIGRFPNACVFGRPSGIPSIFCGDVVRITDPSFRHSLPFEKSERVLFGGVIGPRVVLVLFCRGGRWKALRVHLFHIVLEEWVSVGTRDFDADRRGIDGRKEQEIPSRESDGDFWVRWDADDDRTDGVVGSDDALSDHMDAEGELPPVDPPRGVRSSVLKGVLARESNGALFPAQIDREGEQQLRGVSIARLKKQEDGSFRLTEFDRIAQKDIVERFNLPAEGRLPESILQRLAEEAPQPEPPVPQPVTENSDPVDVDFPSPVDGVVEQVAKEARAAEFVRWSQMTKKQRKAAVRENREKRCKLTEKRISKAMDMHFEVACAVLKAERARKLLQRENKAKGHILATEEEIEQGLFKEADRKELVRWCVCSVFDLSSQTLTPQPGVKGITLRWIRTWKLKEGKRVAKSRLVARGFHDPRDSELLETYSGTADAGLTRVAFVWALSRGW
uniref:Integrase catalytic domain-containing protein n=1 Tax=Chromera velia CCMP2878 TaxID=1169474 RepID=A0A0G4FN68_9ALVE|eukprot:Cvel_17917.t1-p1 / transcript=Cvel_17917.t1 / gene=Cvel_17917 / organism=Chromera_velia_CCMP2878 / gene_product=hypothetical protein / transcript_product=hypothetical protein / location=Cvel_scaffold1455:32423-34615(+) / protein_length=731 / sequence_SO=supercontig / SO=protein_coding / is_pseudo=false